MVGTAIDTLRIEASYIELYSIRPCELRSYYVNTDHDVVGEVSEPLLLASESSVLLRENTGRTRSLISLTIVGRFGSTTLKGILRAVRRADSRMRNARRRLDRVAKGAKENSEFVSLSSRISYL